MPNFITHSYFGDLVVKSLEPDKQELIEQRRDLFYMGANGPDLFFSFRELNFGLPSLANQMQFTKAFEVFAAAAAYLQEHPEDSAASVYFVGLLCHYALDSVAHPYVCYAVDNCFFADYPAKYQKSMHTIMEVYFDEYIIKNKQNLQLTSYNPKNLITAKKADRHKMAQLYQDIVLPIYQMSTSNKAMSASIWIAYFFHRITNDKKGRKRRLYELVELPIGYSKLTCFLKPIFDSEKYDFLNNNRRPFRKVRNEKELTRENFDEIIARAHKLCIELIKKFDSACKGGTPLDRKDFLINYEGVKDPNYC